LGQVVEVHGETAVFIDEWIPDYHPFVIFNGAEKREISGRLDENAIARFGEGVDDLNQTRDDAGGEERSSQSSYYGATERESTRKHPVSVRSSFTTSPTWTGRP
jgi:hypothetical protein